MKSNLIRRALTAGSVALVATLFFTSTTLAHERRTIAGGAYDVVVGWDVEPAIEGQKNAASIRITKGRTNPAEPLEGAEKTLKIRVRQGGSTEEAPLRAVFGQKGYYVADLIPTRVGDCVFTFTGTIDSNQVNESFDSADGKFNGVTSAVDLQFPVKQAGPSAVTASIAQAQDAAQSATTLAYAGIALGVLGILAGVLAWATRPRTQVARSTRTSAVERT